MNLRHAMNETNNYAIPDPCNCYTSSLIKERASGLHKAEQA